MTDEAIDLWVALWEAADDQERKTVRAVAERTALLWWCGCGNYHDHVTRKCSNCGQWRDPEARQVQAHSNWIIADFLARIPK